MERAIGAEFDIGMKRYRTIEASDGQNCRDCALYAVCRDGYEGLRIADAYAGRCSGDSRTDKTNVIFITI